MTNTKRVLFFAYAQEMKQGVPFNASTRGTLRERGKRDAAARFIGEARGSVVYGQARPITLRELKALDREEAPQYRRTHIVLTDGRVAISYMYTKPDFEELPLIESGRFTGPRLG